MSASARLKADSTSSLNSWTEKGEGREDESEESDMDGEPVKESEEEYYRGLSIEMVVVRKKEDRGREGRHSGTVWQAAAGRRRRT